MRLFHVVLLATVLPAMADDPVGAVRLDARLSGRRARHPRM